MLQSGVYRNPSNVDTDLVEEIFAPSCDPGAREVFVSVITGINRDEPGPLGKELAAALRAQGIKIRQRRDGGDVSMWR